MTGQAPEVLPSTFQPQEPGRLGSNQPITGVRGPDYRDQRQDPQSPFAEPTGMKPEDRVQWLVDQNVRATQATDMMLGNQPAHPDTAMLDAIRRVVRTAKDPDAGPKFLDYLRGDQQKRFKAAYDQAYLETGDPDASLRSAQKQHGYVPPLHTLESDPSLLPYDVETLRAQGEASKSRFNDWIFRPISLVPTTLMQLGADTGIGLINLLGTNIPHRDIRSLLSASVRAIAEDKTFEDVYQQEKLGKAVYESQRDWVSRVLQGGGELTGEVLSLAGGPGKWLLAGIGGKAAATTAGAAEAVYASQKVVKAVELATKGAVGFGLLDFARAQGEGGKAPTIGERLKAGGLGALLGPVFEAAGAMGKLVYRGVMMKAVQREAQGLADKGMSDMRDSVLGWAEKSGVTRNVGEKAEDYMRRIIDNYVDAGLPGAKLNGAKFYAAGARGLTESVGMSAVDLDFSKDVYTAIFGREGDPHARSDALKRAAEKMVGGALGLAFLHYGGSFRNLKYDLRRQVADFRFPSEQGPQQPQGPLQLQSMEPGTDLRGQGPLPQGKLPRVSKTASEASVAENKAAAQRELADQALGERLGVEGESTLAGESRRVQGVPASEQTSPEESLAADVQREKPIPLGYEPNPDLARSGWSQDPEAPKRVAYQGSPYAYEVEGDVARPNEELRKALKLPESMPLDKFERKVGKASLLSSLQSKVWLPGEEITPTAWIAEPAKKGEEVGKIRKVQFGNVMERPLSPEGKWTQAESVETRKPDQIPPSQQHIADVLSQMADGRHDLAPEDKAVLGGVRDVLKNVSMDRDPAVRETIEALHSGALDQALVGPPEAAGEAIKAIGEMLTTKAPEVALGELAQQVAAIPRLSPELLAAEARVSDLRRQVNATTRPSSSLLTAYADAADVRAHILNREYDERVRRARQPMPFVSLLDMPTDPKEINRLMGREGESGAILVLNPVEAIESIMGFLADNPITRFIGEGGLERVRRRIGEDMAARFRKVQTNTSRIRSELQPPLQRLADLPAAQPLDLTDIHWVTVRPGLRVGVSGNIAYHEREWMNRIGWARANLGQDAIPYIEAVDEWLQETRSIARGLGVQVGGHLVAASRSAERLPRHMTAAGARRAANSDDAFVEAHAFLNGMTPQQFRDALVNDGYTDARSMHRSDAIERVRTIRLMGEYLEEDGRVERIMEGRPIRLLEALTASFSARMGMHEEFGPDRSTATQDPYADVIAQATTNGDERQFLATIFREAGGMHGEADITDAERQLREWLRPLTSIATALKLTGTKSALQNLLEPLGAAMSMLGPRHVAQAYAEVARAYATGGFQGMRDLQERLVQEGGFLRMIHDPSVGDIRGGTTAQALAGVTEMSQLLSRGTMAGFDFSQDIADTIIRIAIGNRVRAMETGNSDRNGIGFALAMGFPHAEAVRLNEGNGNYDDYQFLLRMGLPHFTARGDVQMNRTPLKKTAARLQTAFMSYLIKQVGRLQTLGAAVNNARNDAERHEAALAMLKFLGFTAASGLLVNSVWELLFGKGFKGLADMGSDFSTIGGASREIGYALLTGIGGGLGTVATAGLKELFSDREQKAMQMAESAGSFLSAPVGLVFQLGEFAYSLFEPTADTRYRGYGPTAKTWLAVQNLMPIARDADRLFARFAGLGLTDPDVQASRTKAMKWREKNDVLPDQHGTITEFNTMIRHFELEMQKPDALKSLSADHIAAEIEKQMPPGKEPKDAAESLRGRKTLTFLDKLPEKKQAEFRKYMGRDRMATLQGYDAMLDEIADSIYPEWMRGGGRRSRR